MIGKIITYKGKEYQYVFDSVPDQYCDFCAFSEICSEVIQHKRDVEDSPMPLFNELSEEFNTYFANFKEIV